MASTPAPSYPKSGSKGTNRPVGRPTKHPTVRKPQYESGKKSWRLMQRA